MLIGWEGLIENKDPTPFEVGSCANVVEEMGYTTATESPMLPLNFTSESLKVLS